MFRARQHDHAPRLEMMPLIDVVFLLLTFFIYSFVVMIDAKVLPITLSRLASGSSATAQQLHWVTIDSDGRYALNRKVMEWSALDAELVKLAADKTRPTLYVVVESKSDVNLWPPFLKLFDRAREVGMTNIAIVGRGNGSAPGNAPSSAPSAPSQAGNAESP